jgi:hypothetical protein
MPVEEWQHAILVARPDTIDINIEAKSLHHCKGASAANEDVSLLVADALAVCTSNVAISLLFKLISYNESKHPDLCMLSCIATFVLCCCHSRTVVALSAAEHDLVVQQ